MKFAAVMLMHDVVRCSPARARLLNHVQYCVLLDTSVLRMGYPTLHDWAKVLRPLFPALFVQLFDESESWTSFVMRLVLLDGRTGLYKLRYRPSSVSYRGSCNGLYWFLTLVDGAITDTEYATYWNRLIEGGYLNA